MESLIERIEADKDLVKKLVDLTGLPSNRVQKVIALYEIEYNAEKDALESRHFGGYQEETGYFYFRKPDDIKKMFAPMAVGAFIARRLREMYAELGNPERQAFINEIPRGWKSGQYNGDVAWVASNGDTVSFEFVQIRPLVIVHLSDWKNVDSLVRYFDLGI